MDRREHLANILESALNELTAALAIVARRRTAEADEITAHLMGVRLRLLLAQREVSRQGRR